MKFAIAGLCFLGIVAAACAAVLVKGLRTPTVVTNTNSATANEEIKTNENPRKPQENTDVTVLYVARALPVMTIVDPSMVIAKAIPRKDVLPDSLMSPSDVLGKLVATPLTAGQPFTKNCFIDVNNSRQLASIIPIGKRAVGISVTDYAGLEGFIGPGSMVDVMVTVKAQDNAAGARRDAVTSTLLQNIQVLAVDNLSMVSPEKTVSEPTGGTRRVTLLVSTGESKVLGLAMEQGTLSLALRNPLDASNSDNSSPLAVPHQWDTVIIRGGKTETRSFSLPRPEEDIPLRNRGTQDVAKE